MPGYAVTAGLNSFVRQLDKNQAILELQRSLAFSQLGTMGAMPGPGQFGVQSLESQLYVLTYGDSEFKFYSALEKVPVFNLVHYWNILQYYGSSVGSTVGLGALPPVNASFYKRAMGEVKFHSDLRSIPQQLLEIESSIGPLVAATTRDSLMSLIGKVEHSLFWGDNSLNQDNFDGVYAQVKQYAPQNIIDLRGATLTPEHLEQIALMVRQNWGDPSLNHLFAPPQVITPFTVSYIANQRMIPGLWQGGSGNPFGFWDTQYGRVLLRDDRFAERDPFRGQAPVTNLANVPQGLPPSPTVAPTVAVGADALSQFGSSDAGQYAYCFAYGNGVGVSTPSPISTTVTINAGQAATLTIPTLGANPVPTFIRIYRQKLASGETPDYSKMLMVTDVKATISTSGTVFVDRNNDLPGTYTVFYVNTSRDGAHIGKLGDVQKFELAPVSLAYWFVTTWYGLLIMPAPQWTVILKNVGGANVGTPVPAAYS